METPEVWFAVNAQMDGVDPLDTSPNGRMQYLVYIKRQQIRFLENSFLIQAAASEDKDVTKAIESLKKIILPSDHHQVIREAARKQARIQRETGSVFKRVISKSGVPTLRMVSRDDSD